MEFGAVADGETDATAALQSAIDAGPGVVRIPPGSYRISRSLVLASGVAIVGAGSDRTTIRGTTLAAGSHFFVGAAQADASVSELAIMGGGGAVDVRGVYVTNCSRCVLSHLHIEKTSYGIYLSDGSNDSRIVDNVIIDQSTQGIVVQSGRNNRVERNRIDRIGTTNLHQGIYLLSSRGPGSGHVVADNEVSTVAGFCVQLFLQSPNSLRDIRIERNHCVNTGTAKAGNRGGIIVSAPVAGARISDVTIAHNRLQDIHGASALNVEDAADVLVDDNRVDSFDGDCLLVAASPGPFATERIELARNGCYRGASGNGIDVVNNGGLSVHGIRIHDNTIDTVRGVGIWLRAVSDSVVTLNRIKDYNTAGQFSNSGVRIDGPSVRNRVDGNIISTANQENAPFAISIDGGAAAGNSISNNDVAHNARGINAPRE